MLRPNISYHDLAPPLTRSTELPSDLWRLTLDESLAIALTNTEVLRDLGAQVLQRPALTPAIFDPAIQSTDPQFGIAAALAEFDAQFNAAVNYQNNDDVFNNAVIGGGANEVQQDLTTAQFGLQKIAAAGTRFSLRGDIVHDSNDRPSNLFSNVWTTLMEAEVRQPLLQGRGVEFNQIAGPNAQPGLRFSNGVVISRINHDISIAQFERDVFRFVSDVIDAYWQLHFAYRNYDAATAARDSAQKTWDTVKARFENELPGGEADKEAQAREQFFVFEGRVIQAFNGSGEQSAPGVLQAEANLRRLLNLSQTDGRLIRPADEPVVVDIGFDWYHMAQQALGNRAELREQQSRIKQRGLELLAARHFTMPRLDAVALYRNNGLGDDLFGGSGPLSSAFDVAWDGDYQEWEFGVQMDVPIGYRRGCAAVRNAELRLQRERSVLREQQRQILHDLGSSIRRTGEAYALVEVARQRYQAARETVAAREAAFEADAVLFDQLLDAQRQLADAEVAYYFETANWARAMETVARESGLLLTTHHIFLHQRPAHRPIQIDLVNQRPPASSRDNTDYRVAQRDSR